MALAPRQAGDKRDDGLMSSSPSQPWTGGRLSVVPLGLARGHPGFRVGSAGLEGGERVLELFIQKTDTSQAANA